MTDWTLAIIGLVAGSSVLDTLIRLVSGRKTTKIDNATTLANQAMEQASEARHEAASARAEAAGAHEAVNNIRRQLYPHQRWDQMAHKKALEADPEFPPPPDLSI